VLDGNSDQLDVLFIRGDRSPSIHCTENWIDPAANPHMATKVKVPCLLEIEPSAPSLKPITSPTRLFFKFT
jgi:hypothetical protein